MHRSLYIKLIDWKNRTHRKPLILMGARQVGKTFLLEQLFGKQEFQKVYKFDFKENKGALHSCFQESLDPKDILHKLSVFSEQDINVETDLILFDEVQECPRALTSLKYFNEKLPNIFLTATGSYLGLHIENESYPVGQIEELHLFPLSFEEFLLAGKQEKLIAEYNKMSQLEVAHTRLWDALTDYYFVGGLPEVVETWHKNVSEPINTRIEKVTTLHRTLFNSYKTDFGKYSGRFNALHIEAVFENTATQLAKALDSSVKRFRFKDVVSGKKNYQDLFGPIEWLVKAGLCHKVHLVEGTPQLPLKSLTKENIFKLYYFDVGVLGHILAISYKEQKEQNCFISKGFFAENFVLNELKSLGLDQIYSWQGRNSEIEFLLKTTDAAIIPIEVKSGKKTLAKSLKVYKEKFKPDKTIKFVGKAGGSDRKDMVIPLYYAQQLVKTLCFSSL